MTDNELKTANIPQGEKPDKQSSKGAGLVRLALKNTLAYKWMNFKMSFVFACLAFLLCLFTVFNTAVNNKMKDTILSSQSSNYIITQNSTAYKEIKEEYDYKYEDTVRLYNYSPLISKYFGWGIASSSIDCRYFMLEIDGNEYLPEKRIPFNSIAMDGGFFVQNDYDELRYRFGKDSVFTEGGAPSNADELAIGEVLLENYKIEENVLGKKLKVYLRSDQSQNINNIDAQKILAFECTISGVICKEFYELSGHTAKRTAVPALLFHGDNEFFNKSCTSYYRGYFKEWPPYEAVEEWSTRYKRQYYAGNSKVALVATLQKISYLARTLYIVIGTALIISLILTIFLLMDKYIKVFSRSAGILLSFGMRRNRLNRLLALQILILCLIAVPIAAVITISGYFVINGILHMLTTVSLDVSVGYLISILFAGIAAVVVIAFLFFLITLRKIRKKTVKQFLSVTVD